MSLLNTKDILLSRTTQAVAASATAQAVTDAASVTSAGCNRLRLDFYVGKVVASSGVTALLQQSGGELWSATKAGLTVTASTQKTTDGLRAEVTNTTWPTFAASAQADYLHITDKAGVTYALWLDKDAAGTAPSGVLYTAATHKIKVSIVTGGTAAQTAAAARAAAVANVTFAAAFTTGSVLTASFTITQNTSGAVADPAPKTENDGGAGSIAVSVTTTGADGSINLTTNTITSSTHGYVTDDAVALTSTGLAPAGLTIGTVYYVDLTDANSFRLRSKQGDANSIVDITDVGTGLHSFSLVRVFSIVFNSEVAGDQAYLPLQAKIRGAITTGSGDSCQVVRVRVSQPD